MDQNETQTATTAIPTQGALLIGKISQPDGLWSALDGIIRLNPVRGGVLIVFSKDVRGRIGLFCNRFITGAACQTSENNGMAALQELLAVDSGLFGFRAGLSGEPEELAQSLGIDIYELLNRREHLDGTVLTPLETLKRLPAKGDGLLLEGSDNDESLFVGSYSATESLLQQSTDAPVPPRNRPLDKETSLTDESFSYSDWFSESAEKGDGRFRQILLSALPKTPSEPKPKIEDEVEFDTTLQMQIDLNSYRQVVEQERERIYKDIEASLAKGQQREVCQDLELFADLLAQEEKAVYQRWEGLDEIPTPKGTVSGRYEAAVREEPKAPQTKQAFIKKSAEYKAFSSDQVKTMEREFSAKENKRTKLAIAAGVCLIFGTGMFIKTWLENDACNQSVQRGQRQLSIGRYSSAISMFNQAINAQPKNGRAYFYRGIAYSDSGEIDNAVADFDQAAKLGFQPDRSKLLAASTYCKIGDFEKAQKICEELKTAGTKEPEAYLVSAICQSHNQDYFDAERDCSTGLSLVKDEKIKQRLLQERAFDRVKEKSWGLAIEDLNQVVKADPRAETYMLRGDAERNDKRYSDAIKDYSAAIESSPRNYDAYVARGICEQALHQNDLARKDFGRALSINKTGLEALIRRGSINLASGATKQAIDDLADAADLAPNDSETQKLLSKVSSSRGRTARPSKSLIADALRDSSSPRLPSDFRKLVSEGVQLLRDGSTSDAVTYLSEAVRRNPNDIEARRYLAYAFVNNGDSSEAVAQFKALAGLGVLTEKDTVTYAKALAGGGGMEPAIDALSAFLKRSPGAVSVRAELIKMYVAAGFTQKAKSVCDEGLATTSSPQAKSLLQSALGADSSYITRGRPTNRVNKSGDMGG